MARDGRAAVTVVHHLPGRLRLRVAAGSEQAERLGGLECGLRHRPGVTGVRVNGRAASLVVTYDPGQTGPQDVLVAAADLLSGPVAKAVPSPSLSRSSAGASAGTDADDTARCEIAKALAVLLGTPLLPRSLRVPVSLNAAMPLLRHAVQDYRHNGITSHVLEAMAVSISLARSDFTAANTTTFMLALGEYMEHSIARRSDELLKHLLRPAGDHVWVLKDGAEIQIPAAQVRVGDQVVIGAGAVVPVDGTVLSGEALLNEAAMTGESAPVAKGRGDGVLSGTVVEEGRLTVYAEQVGTQTAAARIADYVEQSLTVKSQAQLEAARMADRLVPSVLKLAGLSFVLSGGDWRRAASVLQADYSCALKLATPVAFKSAMFQAGQAGVLVKGASALERLAQADTFLFDKTGTLTTGLLQVTDSITFDQAYTPEDLICLAASVEEHYFHPLALAVVNAARATRNHHFDHQEVEFIVAHGVASVVDGQRIVVGSRHFIEEDEGIDLHAHRAVLDGLYRQGKTLLFIGFGRRLLGVLALKDTVRPNSAATIARLRQLGVKRILLLTGDHRDRADELGRELGLDGVHAELMPQDKANIIAALNAAGARIAFVGDGINDAPALAGAHVGIAMQRGADIARLTADLALLEDDIGRVADARALANGVMKRINTNYRATVGLNTAILGAAALGLLSPVATSVLHNGTTIGILLNALKRGMDR